MVAVWLVPRMRGARGTGAVFRFLSPAGALWRFATARSRRGRFVAEGGASGSSGADRGGTGAPAVGYERLNDKEEGPRRPCAGAGPPGLKGGGS